MTDSRTLNIAPSHLYNERLEFRDLSSYSREAERWKLDVDKIHSALYAQELADWEYVIDENDRNPWLRLKQEESLKGHITRAFYDKSGGCQQQCDTIINQQGLFFVYAFMKAAQDAQGVPEPKDYVRTISGYLGPDKKLRLKQELSAAISSYIGEKEKTVLLAIDEPLVFRYLTPYISYLREGHAVQALIEEIKKLDPKDLYGIRFATHPIIDVKLNTDLLILIEDKVLCGVGVTMDSRLARHLADAKDEFRQFADQSKAWRMTYLLVETNTRNTSINTVSDEQVKRVAAEIIYDAETLLNMRKAG